MSEKITCYCCGFKTLTEGPGEYDICPVCYWEDDGSGHLNNNEPSSVNDGLRLSEAQENYIKYGVSNLKFKEQVRFPKKDEIEDKKWKPIMKV